MTDEERQKLVDDLWLIAGHDRPVSRAICAEAAEEIERLTESLKAVHGYAEECEAKIAMQANQIDRMIIKKLVS
jgi:hypothetical protein